MTLKNQNKHLDITHLLLKGKGIIVIILLALAVGQRDVHAQKVAVKSNLVSDALSNVNLGLEVGLSRQWTLDVTGDVNFWQFDDGKRWKHAIVQPEARYWFCDRFMGHFVGIHAHGGYYNVGFIPNQLDFLGSPLKNLTDARYQGWMVGAGLGYGYSIVLSRHFNLEMEAGIGYAYTRYDRYACGSCGKRLEEDQPHHYVGPTKLAVNLVYSF